jgi:TPR repeat protein
MLACFCLLEAQQHVAMQRGTGQGGMPSSGGYKPSALSLFQLMETDPVLNKAMLSLARTGDRNIFRNTVMNAAQSGNVGAELLLAEQYIPEQCTYEINQDVPHCGKKGDEPPRVVFRTNPLGVDPSYEEAVRWLEKSSAHGSGEASEVLAQLITRMQIQPAFMHALVPRVSTLSPFASPVSS